MKLDRKISLTSIEVSENNSKFSSENGVLFNKNKTEIRYYPIGKTETEYVIPESVTKIKGGAFERQEHLASVTIGENVTEIGWFAFENCKALTSMIIPNSVVAIGNFAFYNCKKLASVTIGSGVKHIEKEAFLKCENLSSVTFNSTEGWNVSKYDDGTNAIGADVTDPAKNAEMLRETYLDYYWLRKGN